MSEKVLKMYVGL